MGERLMQKDGQRVQTKSKCATLRLKQISTVQVSTFEAKVSLKWIVRHPEIKSTDSADLYKPLSAVERGGDGENRCGSNS